MHLPLTSDPLNPGLVFSFIVIGLITGTGTGSSRVEEFRKLVFYISSFRDL